ncbi:bifunctional folylpolyglutamate synthase/dihydrofolate synthase [Candidatus Binatia bacterium]|nr:bifunctional folylpolyglutamate synthase/dihydrofolate synthase [Candidatus Binatia bacterium]
MGYDETLAELIGLEATRGWDLKLERVRAALAALGEPHRGFPAVLIAGTNGKGSTAAMVHAVLGAAGHRVGLYTSPHLVEFTERIRVGDAEIARDDVVRGVARIRAAVDVAGSGLTFFEVTTVLALWWFAECRVDVAVLEVGLGGRLDATNVVEPIVSAVTSIGFDHEDYLGGTLDAIAREKAGVMRPGRVTVLGADLPAEARAALLDEGARHGAILVEGRVARANAVALNGPHMQRNAAVACGVLEALGRAEPRLAVAPEAIARGLARVRWPGRLAVVHEAPRVVLDGAHNVDGARALCAALPAVVGSSRIRLLFSALRDKRWREMASILAPVACEVVVSEVGGKRGLGVDELASAFPSTSVRAIADPASALARLVSEDRSTPIVVAGSLFLVGMVYAELMRQTGSRSVFEPRPGADA